ncbi:MAG: acyl-CoA thioesterase [Bdellovibrionaceae bacterium]|nr:acyl-CoA thioesterase [Bdellovibrionales bacterium]MCB9085174.1 acyl-CoA thioesterase [Pseudobdellovibrionaceae bacterium]
MSATPFSYSLTIREAHLDTFGHVNNATYLSLFEEARWELVTQRGYGLDQVRSRQHGPIILDVHLEFRKELKLREKVLITTKLLHYEKRVGQLYQEIVAESSPDLVFAKATFTFGLFDLKARRLIPPTDAWLYAIGAKDSLLK